jgi:tetratricopeptide (TPR) repeat protein
MGLVFRAQQERPVRRTVALKLIRAGADSPDVVARFESERQALAQMNHPNVARVFDAGTTREGRHYFVMEYVAAAKPITVWCDSARASVEQRLNLFIEVCEAVQHAHQRGVIHRDLKPSNVLVSTHDQKPVPKVIDFGVAKAVERPLAGRTLLTHVGQLIGTPEYMSPEQANFGEQDVDTRSDIYALGVVLYELVTGSPPLDRARLREQGLDQVLRTIREIDPPRPSTRVERELADATSAARAREVADHRQTDPTRLVRQLRGELDWIIGKSLEKDRRRRYASAAELADDLRRCLAHEPVLAGPPNTLYRVRKFVRRHRVPVAAAGVLTLAIIAGVLGTSWQAVRATRAERAARQRFVDLRKLVDEVLFNMDESLRTQGPTRTRQLMVTTALKYLDGLANEAAGDLSLRRDLARGYLRVGNTQYARTMTGGGGSLGDLPGALASYRKALELARSVAADAGTRRARADVGRCLLFLGDTQADLENPAAAMRSYEEAKVVFESLSAADPTDLAAARDVPLALEHIAHVHRSIGRMPDAIAAYGEALKLFEELLRRYPREEQLRLDVALNRQIINQMTNEASAGADRLAHLEQMMPAVRKMLEAEPDNPRRQRDVVVGLQGIADMKVMRGQSAEALVILDEAVQMEERLLRNDPENVVARDDLAESLRLRGDAQILVGKTDNSILDYERALKLRRELASSEGESASRRRVAEILTGLCKAYRAAGRRDEAVSAAHEAVDLYEQRLAIDPDPRNRAPLLTALDLLAETAAAVGREDDAVAARARRAKYDANPGG